MTTLPRLAHLLRTLRAARPSVRDGLLRRTAGRLAAIAVAAIFLAPAPGALALETHNQTGTVDPTGTPQNAFGYLAGVAVDSATGDVYVADAYGAADGTGVVDRFDNTGAFVSAIDGTATPQSSFSFTGSSAVAVDNSGTASDGRLYVTDTNNNLVDAFDPATGTLVAGFGTGGQLDGSTTPAGALSAPCGVAVDSAGNVFVADSGHNRIWIFDNTGAYLDRISDSSLNGPCALAFDSAGNLYALNQNTATLARFDRVTATSFDYHGTVDPNSYAAAVDPSDDHVFADNAGTITEYDSSGNQLSQFGSGTLGFSQGIAVDPVGPKIYAADGPTLHSFGATVTLPDAETDPATNITNTSATLNGVASPHGIPVTDCHFEWFVNGAVSVPCTQDPGSDPGGVPVSADVTGLAPGLTVHYRLVVTNANGTTTGAVESFTTLSPPLIRDEFATPVATTGASLHADINSRGVDTTWHLEWGAADCAANPCASVPVPDWDIGAGGTGDSATDVRVTEALTGLTPDTTYHYRFVATSAHGTTDGPDRTIHTFASAKPFQLPDGRAYEMVSPPDKNGGGVEPNPTRTRVSAGGDAVTFPSLTGFAGAQGSGSLAGVDYVSVRSPGGWSAHAITPVQTAPSLLPNIGTQPRYLDYFSEDLSKGVFLSNYPIAPGSGNTDGVKNLYLRDDLRTPGPGHYTLLTDSTTPIPSEGAEFDPRLGLVDHTPDFSHITFESKDNLIPEATGTESKLYEWENGIVRLAGVLPDSACGSPPCLPPGSTARGRGGLDPETGSGAGGSAYTTGVVHTISTDGSRILFGATPTSQPIGAAHDMVGRATNGLYMRIDHSSTIQLNLSERSTPDPAGTQPVVLEAATADLSKVFFATKEELTDDDTNTGFDLYMWDADRPAGHHLTLISKDAEPSDDAGFSDRQRGGPVLGTSSDGSYVYFTGENQLVSDMPNGSTTASPIYVWHNGTVRFVAWVVDPVATSTALTFLGGAGEQQTGGLSRVTADGQNLVFVTTNDVVGSGVDYRGSDYTGSCINESPGHVYNGEGCAQVFLYNDGSGALRCVSCDPTGAAPVGDANTGVVTEFGFLPAGTQYTPAVITSEGSKVFFSSGDPLVPEDTNGRYDAYEYDVPSGTFHLISTGQSSENSYFVNATLDGSNVFFLTRQRLVGIDDDNAMDLYDARVGGGIAAQNQTPAEPCSGDVCRGTAATAPSPPVAGSVTFSGPGNPTPQYALQASVKALTKTVHGARFKIRVRVNGPGRIAIAGVGINAVSKTVARAGSYVLTVRLTPSDAKALRRKHKLRLNLDVGYTQGGANAASATLRLTVKR